MGFLEAALWVSWKPIWGLLEVKWGVCSVLLGGQFGTSGGLSGSVWHSVVAQKSRPTKVAQC